MDRREHSESLYGTYTLITPTCSLPSYSANSISLVKCSGVHVSTNITGTGQSTSMFTSNACLCQSWNQQLTSSWQYAKCGNKQIVNIITFTTHDKIWYKTFSKCKKFRCIATLLVFSAWFMLCLSLSLKFLGPLLHCWSFEVSCRSVVKQRKVILAAERRQDLLHASA